jgi:16S rRNA processing protein RimM
MVEYLKIGQIINTHGVKGEVKVYPLTDNIKRFKGLKQVWMESPDGYRVVKIEGLKFVKDFPIMKLEGIITMNDAEKLRDQYIYVDRENAVKLPKDTYFISDLIGIQVFTEDKKSLGTLTDVIPTGANDVYEITPPEGRSFLIPAIGDVVLDVDIEGRRMVIKLLEGLI